MSEELNEIEEVSEIDTEEQECLERERLEHEEYLNSFPDTTVFYQELKEKDGVKWLCGTVTNAALADQLGFLDNHYDFSELTLIKGIFYLKGYEKPDETEAEIIRKKASEIDHELENLLDKTVQARNYKNVESCVGYYNSTDKTFREEAEAVLKWRDSLYATAREILKQVNEGSIDYRIVNLKYITDRAEPLEW